MPNERKSTVSVDADRMGRFIGQLRTHEGIPLHKLAHGLCSPAFLNRIENGKREVGKQMTDAFFQRLGKPVELFDRILDWGEFQRWKQRQDIITHLRRGEADDARSKINTYLTADAEVLDQQFARIVEINCRYLEGADAQALLPMVRDALLLTQPDFGEISLDAMLLSQNEGRLLFAYLQLREKIEGTDAVAEDYRALLKYFKQPRYESRERVYLHPYIACQVIEIEYFKEHYSEALEICEDALDELTNEKRLYAYDRLLAWKQKLHDAMCNPDRMPEKLLEQLKLILAYAPKRTELLIPCDEQGNVYCLNQVIRDRRRLLGISQEALAEGICDPRTLIRIENHGGNLHRKNRRALLQQVNMSGERYDYEVITDRYEDYLLRSELGRIIQRGENENARTLLSQLSSNIPDALTNRQYMQNSLASIEIDEIRRAICSSSYSNAIAILEDSLLLTIPRDVAEITTWPTSILSINEFLNLILCSHCYKKDEKIELTISVLMYAKNCLEHTIGNAWYYDDLYTRVLANIASTLGDIGKYNESCRFAEEGLSVSVEKQACSLIAQYLYGIAWNLIQQKPTVGNDTAAKTISLLKQAYAASIISGRVYEQDNIASYYRKVFDEDIAL